MFKDKTKKKNYLKKEIKNSGLSQSKLITEPMSQVIRIR